MTVKGHLKVIDFGNDDYAKSVEEVLSEVHNLHKREGLVSLAIAAVDRVGSPLVFVSDGPKLTQIMGAVLYLQHRLCMQADESAFDMDDDGDTA